MKGLLFKDWCQIKAYGKLLLVSVLVMMICSVFTLQDGTSIFVVYACFILGNLSTTLIAYDSNSGWNLYANVLPLSREQIVGEKFFIVFCTSLLGAVLSGLTAVAALCSGASLETTQVLSLIVQDTAIVWISGIVMLPVYYRFGAEKARYVYLLLVAMAGCCAGIMMSMEQYNIFLNTPWKVQALLVVLTAALSILSWQLSIAWYGMAERNK